MTHERHKINPPPPQTHHATALGRAQHVRSYATHFFEGAQFGIGRDLSFEPPMLSGSRDAGADRHFWSQRGLGEARIARHGGHFTDLEDSLVFYATSQTLESLVTEPENTFSIYFPHREALS